MTDHFGANITSTPAPTVQPEWNWLSEMLTPSAVADQAVVGPGVAAGAVEQDLIEGVADAATNGTHRADRVVDRREDRGMPTRRADVRPGAIDLEAEHEVAGLPVVAGGAAGEAAAELPNASELFSWA